MDFCTRCGNELTSEDQICGKCGNDVRAKRATVEHIHDHSKEEHVKGAVDEGMDPKQKKRLLWIIVAGIVLVLGTVVVLLVWFYLSPPFPVVQQIHECDITKTVGLEEEFKLTRQSPGVRIRGIDAQICLVQMKYDPHQVDGHGGRMDFSLVTLEFVLDGQVRDYRMPVGHYALQEKGNPYNINFIDSNFLTHVTLTIDKEEDVCSRMTHPDSTCWRGLATRLEDPKYCEGYQNAQSEDNCREFVAEQFKDAQFCDDVTDPKQYCLYRKLVDDRDLASCRLLSDMKRREACYRDIANTFGLYAIADRKCQELLPKDEVEDCLKALDGELYVEPMRGSPVVVPGA